MGLDLTNKTRAEIDAFVKAKQSEPSTEIPHEHPPMENGPSVVCSACAVVRINPFGPPFCKRCVGIIAAMG
jgi:hypothetical protein